MRHFQVINMLDNGHLDPIPHIISYRGVIWVHFKPHPLKFTPELLVPEKHTSEKAIQYLVQLHTENGFTLS